MARGESCQPAAFSPGQPGQPATQPPRLAVAVLVSGLLQNILLAHWGNDRFSRLRPYQTMVFATTYHDSGYREWEGTPPMNVQKGRPYAHREDVPNFESVELNAYAKNVDWLGAQDPYAGLLVSMHRTGLWHNR